MAKKYFDDEFEKNYRKACKSERHEKSRSFEAKQEAMAKKKARKAERELSRLANSY